MAALIIAIILVFSSVVVLFYKLVKFIITLCDDELHLPYIILRRRTTFCMVGSIGFFFFYAILNV